MTLHTTPVHRKEMAHAISELLGEPAVYMRTPTYAFRIGNVTVNRDGSTSCDDTATLERIQPLLIENGYLIPEPIVENAEPATEAPAEEASQEAADKPTADLEAAREETIQEPGSEIERMNLTMPMEGINVQQLKNLLFTLYSKQKLLNKALGTELLHIDQSVVTRLQEFTPETVEEFETLLEDFKALDALSGVTVKDKQLTLEFPFDIHEPTLWTQYGMLQRKLIDAAMKATRTKPQLSPLGDIEKYLMHSWLIRIGCDGPDFKALRKLLLNNLTGYCAFPDQARADKHKAKYAELRRIRREVNEEANARDGD